MTEKKPAIYSTLEDNPEVREAIHDFVIGLAEKVDQLQDAEVGADLELLGSLAGDLSAEALALGYAPLAKIAEQVAVAARDQKHETAREDLEALTDTAQRIRQGHRGAA